MRKAKLPIAYSEGFSPHPRVSFPDALPLGYASTGEYAELAFTAPLALDAGVAALNEAFPEGLDVLAAFEVTAGAPRLSRWLQASLWEMAYPAGSDALALAVAVDGMQCADRLPVGRERKGETIEIDLRPALCHATCEGTTIAVVLHHVDVPVRPSEVHAALRDHYPSDGPHRGASMPEPTLVTRVAQGTATRTGLAEALTGAEVPLAPSARTPERTTTP